MHKNIDDFPVIAPTILNHFICPLCGLFFMMLSLLCFSLVSTKLAVYFIVLGAVFLSLAYWDGQRSMLKTLNGGAKINILNILVIARMGMTEFLALIGKKRFNDVTYADWFLVESEIKDKIQSNELSRLSQNVNDISSILV